MKDIQMNLISTSVRFALVPLLACVSSCTPSSPDSSSASSPHAAVQTPASDPASVAQASWTPNGVGRHWVQNQQLRNLMKAMNTKTQANWPRNVPQDPEDPRSDNLDQMMANAAALSDSLANTALLIPVSAKDSKMSEADSAGFQAEATTLHRQALRLGVAAKEKNIERMQISLDALGDTCISCHSRYRDFSGELRSQ
jgi:cytochrome c556